ncbi:PAS domain-containing protein [Mesobaculum littorinae]|uniref:PAS domain-containing protein n=1 Tax=Mesobaculum littorinae TaxID=2486419 RepID=A0A438AH07_9RHOB|nr:PAS-domain containing protein [Mesobaculum littorinae]RVV97996.1 PAS domain-containing protein [Mesobaculum littorinae]
MFGSVSSVFAVSGLTALATVAAGLLLTLALTGRARRAARIPQADDTPLLVCLFEDRVLQDATDEGRRFLDIAPPEGDDLSRFLRLIDPRFPGVEACLADLAPGQTHEMVATDGDALLRLTQGESTLSATLLATGDGVHPTPEADLRIRAMDAELELLRHVAQCAPTPMWLQSDTGVIEWVNRAYIDLCQARLGEDRCEGWPPPALFSIDFDGPASSRAVQRLLPDGAGPDDRRTPPWHDCHVEECGTRYLVTAIAAQALVRAETRHNDVVQTLSKIFAQLPLGLVVFGREREMLLFNPALADLIGLPPADLLTMPDLYTFLDALRDRRTIPEPKDYKEWRDRLTALDRADSDGSFTETWHLADGKIVRVTGMLQPQGALSLMFSDVTDEILRSRRHRLERETDQAVLDSLPDAIAVFSTSGIMVVSNRAYDRLWKEHSLERVAPVTLGSAIEHWGEMTFPTPVWCDLRGFAEQMGTRAAWPADVQLRDGRRICCRFEPLPGGALMVIFAVPGLANTLEGAIWGRIEPVRRQG